jgi:hypothetical protein
MPEAVPPTDPDAPVPAQTDDLPPVVQGSGVERRRGKRLTSHRLVHCLIAVGSGEPTLAAMVLDVSRLGVGLIVARPVQPGSALVVRLPEAGQGRPTLDLTARAAHCGELMTGRYLVGAEFVEPLGEEELGSLLSRMKRTPARGG